ncbi:hypothetical protein BDV95DRAFT_456259, partial [Massariosphaeria phaeospora]
SPLPPPRKRPLQTGSAKESELIRFLDRSFNNVQKRCDNRVTHRKTTTPPPLDAQGYAAFGEAAKDIDGLVNVIWVSGSPNLQIPYLLTTAVLITEFLPLFAPAPRATLDLLDKIDVAFASLLQGRNIDTGEPLAGFEMGRTVSTTDKVRLKGIVERTRLAVVRVLAGGFDEREGRGGGGEETDEGDTSMGEETDADAEGFVKFEGFDNDDDEGEGEGGEDEEEREERRIGKVYEKTLVELGDVLGGPPIGIITDD